MPEKDYFAQLSLKQKAELFDIYIKAGYRDLSSIKSHYNSEMDRAYNSTDKDMMARMHDVNAPYLTDEDGNKMTHMMASGDGYVFPTIQRNDNGDLEDYSVTPDWGARRAIEHNDTLQFRLPSLAEYFSENYKTHLDNPIMHANGGGLQSPFKKPLPEVRFEDGGDKSSEQIRGEYLPLETQKYFGKFKSYDDWTRRARKQDVAAPHINAQAKYYYDNDQGYADYFKLIYGPYKTYEDLRGKYELAPDFTIPFSGETFRLNSIWKDGKPTNKHTMKVNVGLLDYIYDEAIRGGVDPKAAIALAVNESNLGTSKGRISNSGDSVNAFNLMSYWHGTDSVIYPNSKVITPLNTLINKVNTGQPLTAEDQKILADLNKRYTHMAESIHEYKGDNVIADATRYFLAGKYTGSASSKATIDEYNKLVMSRFDELMNDPKFRKWFEGRKKSKKK